MNRILVVDDEAALRETVAAILRRDGHAVDTAQDGAEALRLLDHHRDDLILDGPHLYDTIHQHCRSVMPAVVFVTGHVDDSIDGALQPGALVLEKPFSLHALCGMVERLLAPR